MHYFMIEATPAPDNEQEHGVGGAYVNCWINFLLQDGAEVLARYYIEQADWIPNVTHEHRWVQADNYRDDPENLQYYLEAEADGVSMVFHSWPADAGDAHGDYTRMAEDFAITLETTPNPAELSLVRAGLAAFNQRHAGDDSFAPITLLVRDPSGSVVGGLLGGTYWGWLVVEILWLAEAARHHGLGSQLLARAEQIAIKRGCHAAHLDTMSFQAPAFYQQHGYSIFGLLEDLPRGHQRYFLKKELSA